MRPTGRLATGRFTTGPSLTIGRRMEGNQPTGPGPFAVPSKPGQPPVQRPTSPAGVAIGGQGRLPSRPPPPPNLVMRVASSSKLAKLRDQDRAQAARAARGKPEGVSDPIRLREMVSGFGVKANTGGPAEQGALQSATYDAASSRLHLQYEGVDRPLAVSALWLRDACACPQCVTPSSGQKRQHTHELAAEPGVRSAEAATDAVTGQSVLRVVWEDSPDSSLGEHVGTFDAKALLYRLAGMVPPFYPALPQRRLWDRRTIEAALWPVAYADWMAAEEDSARRPEFYRALLDLHQLGLLVVDGVPDSETAVRDIANQIGHVQTTFYGELFDVVSKPDAENVAYTNVFLGLHQDLLYMNDPPHIQLLHCLRNDCAGGESLFSDSVRAAVDMQIHHAREAHALATLPVRYHYERNGHHYFNKRPVIELVRGSAAAVRRTGWSPPFQDVFTKTVEFVGERRWDGTHASSVHPADDHHLHLLRWRTAARVFNALVDDPDNLFEFKLRPGQCVLFDNRRVLHGRRQFDTGSQGSRWLKGAYIDEQTFQSKIVDMVRRGKVPAATAADRRQMPKFPLLGAEQAASDVAQVHQLLAARAEADVDRRMAGVQPKDWGEAWEGTR